MKMSGGIYAWDDSGSILDGAEDLKSVKVALISGFSTRDILHTSVSLVEQHFHGDSGHLCRDQAEQYIGMPFTKNGHDMCPVSSSGFISWINYRFYLGGRSMAMIVVFLSNQPVRKII